MNSTLITAATRSIPVTATTGVAETGCTKALAVTGDLLSTLEEGVPRRTWRSVLTHTFVPES